MKHRMRIRISEKRMGKRLLASVMAAVTASTAIAVPASAAPPRVQVDETMYVNLDYYVRDGDQRGEGLQHQRRDGVYRLRHL